MCRWINNSLNHCLPDEVWICWNFSFVCSTFKVPLFMVLELGHCNLVWWYRLSFWYGILAIKEDPAWHYLNKHKRRPECSFRHRGISKSYFLVLSANRLWRNDLTVYRSHFWDYVAQQILIASQKKVTLRLYRNPVERKDIWNTVCLMFKKYQNEN